MSVKEIAVISVFLQVRDKHTDELGQPAPLELHMATLPLTPYSGKGEGEGHTYRKAPEFLQQEQRFWGS